MHEIALYTFTTCIDIDIRIVDDVDPRNLTLFHDTLSPTYLLQCIYNE